MCYPKPGPRCAGHLRRHLATLEARHRDAVTAFMAGHDTEDPREVTRAIEQAREEYAETRTARIAEADRIAGLPEGPEKTRAQAALDAATLRHRHKVDAYKASTTPTPPVAPTPEHPPAYAVPEDYVPNGVIGELGDHELAHLGIFTATLEDGRIAAHNAVGGSITCPHCRGERATQATCSECAGRGIVNNIPYCDRNWDTITAGLHLGGHDNQPGGGDARVTDQFDVVVSLYDRDGYGPNPDVPHHTHAMIDGDLHPDDHPHVHRLADVVVAAMDNDQTVLVRCQAGMNRSALIAGLALIKRGWTTDDILAHTRRVRSPYVLFNNSFVAYLRDQEAELGIARPRCTACFGNWGHFGVVCQTCGGTGTA